MRIGIVTFWQSGDNYGQLLQAWALQRYLRAMGHEPFLIRYDIAGRKIRPAFWKRCVKLFLVYPACRKAAGMLRAMKEKGKRSLMEAGNRRRRFDEFRETHLAMSGRVYGSLAELRRNPPEADCYVTGSDQVWAQLLSVEENRAFFLDFGDASVRRVAYAPSFSMSEYPSRLRPLLKGCLERLDSVSVREEAGVEICGSVGTRAVRVVDPTLLLDREDYLPLLAGGRRAAPYVYVYCPNISSPDELRWDELKSFARGSGTDILATTASGYVPGYELLGGVPYVYPTVPEWLAYMDGASLVVTSSFHGVAFCVLLETPFVYVPLKGRYSRGNGRVLDLLRDLGLGDRILRDGKPYAGTGIGWAEVEERLRALRGQSVRYLREALA